MYSFTCTQTRNGYPLAGLRKAVAVTSDLPSNDQSPFHWRIEGANVGVCFF